MRKDISFPADETDWENHKYLENGCRDVFTWKGEGYRAQDEEIKSVYEKYKDKKPEQRPKPKIETNTEILEKQYCGQSPKLKQKIWIEVIMPKKQPKFHCKSDAQKKAIRKSYAVKAKQKPSPNVEPAVKGKREFPKSSRFGQG